MTVDTRHGSTCLIACGASDGPALVLIHGAGSNALMWMAEVETLARRHRVFAVDVIGEPGRSAATRPSWKGAAYSEWLADVLDGLGVKTARLLALSQGGWIALRFATTCPERVEKLALLAPAGVVGDRLSFLLRVAPLFLLGRRGARAITRIVAGPKPMNPEALEAMETILTHLRPHTYPFPLFSDEELGRLRMPVLLVGGEEDAIRDCRAIAARLRGLLPRFEARILPEAGHALLEVAALVTPFLEQP